MCDIKNYKKIINFMENTNDMVGPKVGEFVDEIPQEIVDHLNSKQGKFSSISKEGIWKCDKSSNIVRINYHSFALENGNYVKSSSIELMFNDVTLGDIASADVAKFSQKIYNGEKCVRSIDAKFNVKQIAKNNFICDYDVKHYNTLNPIVSTGCQTAIEL